MATNPIPVVFSPAAEDACAFYRMWIPHLNLPLSDYYFSGWNKDGTPAQMDLNRVLGKRVVIVQRQASIHNLRAMQNMKACGLKVIYDLDDNLWNLPHGNPAKKAFQQYANQFSGCAQVADIVTVSTQGLKTAAATSLTHRKEILIVPNAIDFTLFKKKDIKRDDDLVVIGWGGSNTHTDDVKDVFRIIPEVLAVCPKAMVEVAGASPKKEAKQHVQILEILKREETVEKTAAELREDDTVKTKKVMMPYALLVQDIKTKVQERVPWREFKSTTYVEESPFGKRTNRVMGMAPGMVMTRDVLIDSELAHQPQFRFKNWIPTREYPNRLASWAWDISIAPLEDVRFNNSKSNIKMLESAALKIPCLVSPIQPYIEFCALGGMDLNWLLCHNLSEWKEKLITLINEPERREYLGRRMYEVAKKYFDIEVIRNHWNYAFEKVLQ
jgi:glycosyltransferase involved in cell wall biosynthesis